MPAERTRVLSLPNAFALMFEVETPSLSEFLGRPLWPLAHFHQINRILGSRFPAMLDSRCRYDRGRRLSAHDQLIQASCSQFRSLGVGSAFENELDVALSASKLQLL